MFSPTDPTAALFEQLRPRLAAISCRILGSDAEADDVVQDCFLKWQITDQSALLTPAAWLTTVVQHQSIDRLRQRARDAIAVNTAAELFPAIASGSPEQELLRREELGEALARLLSCLSPAQRCALVLHEVFGCEHAAIAAALGTQVVTARQHLARARRRLSERSTDVPSSERLCRELIRRFQAAINDLDIPAMLTLLGDEQPMSVIRSPQVRNRADHSANDALYALARSA